MADSGTEIWLTSRKLLYSHISILLSSLNEFLKASAKFFLKTAISGNEESLSRYAHVVFSK